MAEVIFNNLSKGEDKATSAGTKVVREDVNREGNKITDANVIEVMKEIGIDLSGATRNQLTLGMFEQADKVVVIEPSERIPEYVRASEKTTFWKVDDTFKQNLEFTRRVRNELQVLVNNFIEASKELKFNNDTKIH